MNKKNLPIKIFEKRKEIDERRVEGGGSGKDPKWVLPLEELEERISDFTSVIHEKIEDFNTRSENRKFIPSTISLEINSDAIAKSHRSTIKQIFNVNYKSNFIGFSGENSVIVKIDNENDAKAIEGNIRNIKKYQVGLSAISDIDNFEPEILVDKETPSTVKVSILNYQDYELNNGVKSTFEIFCKEKNIHFKKTNYAPELIIYKITEADKGVIDSLKEFEAIESISFMPQYQVGLDTTDIESELDAKVPIEGVEYPTVGILDSGVAKNKYTTPWLLEKNHTSYPPELIDSGHGTFVTGVILYGDELEERTLTGLEGCKIFDATVIPDSKKESIMEDELIENIREAIKDNSEIKIWNMSLGTNVEVDDHEFSHFGQALDNIQEAYNVLICKSAGNCTNFIKGNPKSKISKSADSVNSLVVGSIAHKKNGKDLSEINNPSPFTRIGRGPANIIKPELVSYGGNAYHNGTSIVKNGVRSISTDGHIVADVGTSFSTPRITALLAALSLNIKEKFNPLLLKALAIHSASYPAELTMKINDRLKQVGFGLPAPVQDIIYNDEHEVTLILQDTLVKGEFMEILEFPYPDSLIDDDENYYGNISLTIASGPVLRNQGGEYCQSNLEVILGTYDEIKNRDTSKPTILNEIGPDGPVNVLRDANYGAEFKKDAESTYAKERILLNYGKKYNPVKKYSVNLEEMTIGNKEKALKAPKKWYLKVRGLYRDFAEEMAQQDGEELNQELALIITIRDNKKEQQVYNEVTQLLNNRNFNHSNINIASEVRVKNQFEN
jgi:Subtilase family